MPTVTGVLTDFGLSPVPGLQPVIRFTAAPGIDGNSIRIDRGIEAIPAADGTFSATLASTDTLRPATGYRMSVKWLDAAGNFIGFNEIPGELYVPPEGGALEDLLISFGGAPGLTWVSLTEPPLQGPFTSWLRVDPTNQDDYDPTTGDYYEWS